MKQSVFILGAFLLAFSARAEVLQVGDAVPNICWQNHEENEICLDDMHGKTRVLIYNAMY